MHQFLDTLYGNDYTVKGIQSPIQHPAGRNNSLQILEFCIALFYGGKQIDSKKNRPKNRHDQRYDQGRTSGTAPEYIL